MPYILGTVSQQNGGNTAPCMSFQVECLNKPGITPVINHIPPYFWVTVGVDEYVLKITSGTGASQTAIASALSETGGVLLNISVA